MRIGYFGGTFDPPHRGHLRVAQAAAETFSLDRILLTPTGRQPLKRDVPTPYPDRLAMVRLLCAAGPRLEASNIDAPHADSSPNYTIDALRKLRVEFAAAELFSIVGADSFLNLRQWRESDNLLGIADWIVVSRPAYDVQDLSALELTPQQLCRVHLLSTVEDDTTATGVRERLRAGVAVGDRLTPEVMLYIARMRLYHND